LWTAGITTWLGSSSSSCWMRSPRSVSDHNRIVLDILRKHGAKSLVKSKSMLTEECGFRHLVGAERAGEHLGDVEAGLVDRRHHHVARLLVVELLAR
jgi:hypothetical protein